MKINGCNQSRQSVKGILQSVKKNTVASKIRQMLSQLFSLTACQQLLLHTCDRLGLQRLGVNTPRVPYCDVSLLYPAMHPQYVTVTQKILSLKFSVEYKIQIRDYGE